jgi:hypothetical protein
MKCSIIVMKKASEFETEVNREMEGKDVVTVKFTTDFAIGPEGMCESWFNALILYNESE